MQIRRFTLPTLGATGALALVALTAGAASAHVTVTPNTTAAGAYAVLTFSVGHGCEGSPTTSLAIQMPESIPSVTPTINPGWDVEKVSEKLAEPIKDAHGNEVTERTAQVVYTAKTPLPDGYRDTVELSVQLPDAVGDTIAFPVVQTCQEGETGWTETAAEGQDPEELESPAPTITISEATGEGHGGSATDTHADTESDAGSDEGSAAADAESADDGDGNGLAIGGLVAGVGGLALGGFALARSGKKA
ncbi:YcnI family protein [Nocardioides humi]|uniref:YncI copper-binding domain-containing protein n=1 Tax=Nocardioides humi TaxID=449461 RepID=A0ABN2A1G7_9ACTN|nr:YcnI family protein [Nocardioides humi]